MFADNPIFGVGYGRYSYVAVDTRYSSTFAGVHSIRSHITRSCQSLRKRELWVSFSLPGSGSAFLGQHTRVRTRATVVRQLELSCSSGSQG